MLKKMIEVMSVKAETVETDSELKGYIGNKVKPMNEIKK